MSEVDIGLGDNCPRADVIQQRFRTTGLEHFAAENGRKSTLRNSVYLSVMRTSENTSRRIMSIFQWLTVAWQASPLRRGSQASHWRWKQSHANQSLLIPCFHGILQRNSALFGSSSGGTPLPNDGSAGTPSVRLSFWSREFARRDQGS